MPKAAGELSTGILTDNEARFDHALVPGMRVTPYYDALLGKLISHEQTRADAICKMRRYLDELRIDGIKTNINQHKSIITDDRFLSGKYFTNFLKNEVI